MSDFDWLEDVMIVRHPLAGYYNHCGVRDKILGVVKAAASLRIKSKDYASGDSHSQESYAEMIDALRLLITSVDVLQSAKEELK